MRIRFDISSRIQIWIRFAESENAQDVTFDQTTMTEQEWDVDQSPFKCGGQLLDLRSKYASTNMILAFENAAVTRLVDNVLASMGSAEIY